MTRHAVFLMVAVCVSSDKFLKNMVSCIFFLVLPLGFLGMLEPLVVL